ncbi:mRNA cleavage and polyadenylation factor subunit [Dimargaris xerosporica]|nr:mRNA cleavage and polyadenylation factor subunit [Dimargaris xerosporica]
MSLYPAYQELIPPTAVDHCVSGRLLGRDDDNLIVARANVLEVYRVYRDDSDEDGAPWTTSTFKTEYVLEDPTDQYATQDSHPVTNFTANDDDSSEFRSLQAISQANAGTPRLRLMLREPLQAQIASLLLVKTMATEQHGRCSLVVAFAEAKMALMEYSPCTHRLVTVSLHYYERDDYRRGFIDDTWPPQAVVDPASRCVVLQMYRDRLAVLPLRQTDALGLFATQAADTTRKRKGSALGAGAQADTVAKADQMISSHPDPSRMPYLPSFVLDLQQLDSPIVNVIDVAFLQGYYEPTLAILYEAPAVTWTGNLHESKDTCAVAVLSLDLEKQTTPVIYHRVNLPYDCIRLVPVPSPTGGILVVTANALIYLDQGQSGLGVAVNSAAVKPEYTEFSLKPAEFLSLQSPDIFESKLQPDPTQLVLERSESVFLDYDTMLMVLASGQLLLVRCVSHGRSVSELQLALIGRSVVPSCACLVRSDLLFLGSGLGDSILIHLQIPARSSPSQYLHRNLTQGSGTNGLLLLESNNATRDLFRPDRPLDHASLVAGLGGAPGLGELTTEGSNSRAASKWYKLYRFKLCDALLCLAPVHSMCSGPFVESPESAGSVLEPKTPGPDDDPEWEHFRLGHKTQLVLCTGHERSGAVAVLQRYLYPEVVTNFTLPGVERHWTVRLRTSQSYYYTAGDSDLGEVHDAFLVLSAQDQTLVLATAEEFVQRDDTGFCTTTATLAVGPWANHAQIVQATPKEIRLLDAQAQLVTAYPLDKVMDLTTTHIQSVHVASPYVLLHLSNDAVVLLAQEGHGSPFYQLDVPDHVNQADPIAALCLYDDEFGSLKRLDDVVPSTTSLQHIIYPDLPLSADTNLPQPLPTSATLDAASPPADPITPIHASTMAIDEDVVDFDEAADEDTIDATRPGSISHEVTEANVSNMQNQIFPATAQAKWWCFVYRASGVLQVYSVPRFELVFAAPRFDHLALLVGDQYQEPVTTVVFQVPPAHSTDAPSTAEPSTSGLSLPPAAQRIVEMNVTSFASHHGDVYLCVRQQSGEVVLYRALLYDPRDLDPLETNALFNTPTLTSRLLPSAIKSDPNSADQPSPSAAVSVEAALSEDALRARLALRLIKCSTSLPLHHPTANPTGHPPASQSNASSAPFSAPLLHVFTNIQGYQGWFVGGNQPRWVVMPRGSTLPRTHPMWLNPETFSVPAVPDPPKSLGSPLGITGFASFHSPHCSHGFVMVGPTGHVQLCQLSSHVMYDFTWPVSRVQFRKSVHHVTYHPTMGSYCVVTSEPRVFVLPAEETEKDLENNALLMKGKDLPEDIKQQQNARRSPTPDEEEGPPPPEGIMPIVPLYAIELLSPVTWEVVDRFKFDLNFHVTSLKCLSLNSKETVSGRKWYMTVSTVCNLGEDRPVTGNLYLFDVVEVVPDPRNPQTNRKLKQACRKEMSGSINAICAMNGHLFSSAGTRVYAYRMMDDSTLNEVVFLDEYIYVTNAAALKNFVLVGDAYKGCSFVAHQELPVKLQHLGKDYAPVPVSHCEFLVDDTLPYFLLADTKHNVHLFSFSPRNLHTFAGRKLLRRGDFHIGSQTTAMLRLPGKAALAQLASRSTRVRQRAASNLPHSGNFVNALGGGARPTSGSAGTSYSPKQFCLCGTAAGGVFAMAPIPEKAFKRLQRLYHHLVNTMAHPAGLNPRAYRLVHSSVRLTTNPAKAVVDVSFIGQYLDLIPRAKLNELTLQVGTSLERVQSDLYHLALDMDFF